MNRDLTPRYKLRTLLIVLALLPPLLAGGWLSWQRYQAKQQRRKLLEQAATATQPVITQPATSGGVHIEYMEGAPLIGPP